MWNFSDQVFKWASINGCFCQKFNGLRVHNSMKGLSLGWNSYAILFPPLTVYKGDLSKVFARWTYQCVCVYACVYVCKGLVVRGKSRNLSNIHDESFTKLVNGFWQSSPSHFGLANVNVCKKKNFSRMVELKCLYVPFTRDNE